MHLSLPDFSAFRVLVCGDVMLDRYWHGATARISPEAPVPVVKVEQIEDRPGGAANVVNNIATLGGKVHAVGLVGRDESADGLRAILAANGADVRGLIADDSRPTISKTRIIAGGRATVSQQIVRIDRESKAPMAPAVEAELRAYIKSVLPTVEGVVISDYGSGTVTEGLQSLLIDYCQAKGIPSIVDSRYAVRRFHGIGYVKQNDAEIAAAMGRELVTTEDIVRAAEELRQELAAKGVLVTRGELGMVLVEHGAVHEIPVSDKSEVFDVSGAGDTCVATVILALAAGVAPATAARLSNIASGIAVRKLGTSTVSVRELAEAIEKSREEYTSK